MVNAKVGWAKELEARVAIVALLEVLSVSVLALTAKLLPVVVQEARLPLPPMLRLAAGEVRPMPTVPEGVIRIRSTRVLSVLPLELAAAV